MGHGLANSCLIEGSQSMLGLVPSLSVSHIIVLCCAVVEHTICILLSCVHVLLEDVLCSVKL